MPVLLICPLIGLQDLVVGEGEVFLLEGLGVSYRNFDRGALCMWACLCEEKMCYILKSGLGGGGGGGGFNQKGDLPLYETL